MAQYHDPEDLQMWQEYLKQVAAKGLGLRSKKAPLDRGPNKQGEMVFQSPVNQGMFSDPVRPPKFDFSDSVKPPRTTAEPSIGGTSADAMASSPRSTSNSMQVAPTKAPSQAQPISQTLKSANRSQQLDDLMKNGRAFAYLQPGAQGEPDALATDEDIQRKYRGFGSTRVY